MSSTRTKSTVILHNVALFWIKCDPAKPVEAMDEDKPPRWEAQIRVDIDDAENVAIIKGAGLNPKVISDDANSPKPYLRLQVYKPIKNREGKELKPVDVVNGALQPVDPNTIGNNSRGNVRLHVYPYEMKNRAGKVTKSGISGMLMGIQLTLHKIYRSTRKDFTAADYTVVDPVDTQETDSSAPGVDEDDNPEAGAETTSKF